MKTREKIILVLACLALLYGLLDYFILSSGNKENILSETQNQFSDFIEKANTSLANLNLIEQQKANAGYLVSLIEADWKNDPFITIKNITKKSQRSEKTDEMAALIYSGFIKLGNKMLAVIDGMEYTTGEYIKNTGYKVIQITPESVSIDNNENNKIVLYLKEG